MTNEKPAGYSVIQIYPKNRFKNLSELHLEKRINRYLGIKTGKITLGKLYILNFPVMSEELKLFASEGLQDPILQDISFGESLPYNQFGTCIIVGKQAGVTDDEGISAQNTFADMFNPALERKKQLIFTQDIYLFEHVLSGKDAKRTAEEILGNRNIHTFTITFSGQQPVFLIPEVQIATSNEIEIIPLPAEPEALAAIDLERHLALTIEELQAIRNYYLQSEVRLARKEQGLPEDPTDCELEIFAQTWSEHCKHKEFNALINFTHSDTGESKKIDSLFKTYIRKSTDTIQKRLEENNEDWLVKVFTDNAGAVKINDESLFIWKVETHNSPSAIDPYGGAITGILGNNRDPLGTGIGGAQLLFNTNVLCFGPPDYELPLLQGQLHPRRVFEGVRKGIEDGGNKSGIPTVNGSIIFDNRFSGKPLVYCGTGGVLPRYLNGAPSEVKKIIPGDFIISIGGRIGKDGIHGATFSSRNLDEHSPQSAVQIGSPITQKLVSDFMQKAAIAGLIRCSTDCGAGGLSSAIGELAQFSGGASVELNKSLLKYSGLKPWEIFLSESQERMIIVVAPEKLGAFTELARQMDVECSELGLFTASGMLTVSFDGKIIASLALQFLHAGVPKKNLQAEWKKPPYTDFEYSAGTDFTHEVLQLLGSLNICSREPVIRQYDHEVKGKSLIKPLMGRTKKAPQDAAVQRFTFGSNEAVALSNGLMPKFAEYDPYHSAAGAFDEALRQIIAVGGKLPFTEPGKNLFWSVNDNFCVPDSVYHPENNPDGKEKLGALVLMCEALYDSAVYYGIPMTSGKDSMKNDFKFGGTKISVPPTVLFSMATKIPDAELTITSEFKKPDSCIYIIGKSYAELCGSEYSTVVKKSGGFVPQVRLEQAKNTYLAMMRAHEERMLLSAHDISDGGMIISLIECCFGEEFGADIHIQSSGALRCEDILFSESHSRFIISIQEEHQKRIEELFGESCLYLGKVTGDGKISVRIDGIKVVETVVSTALSVYDNGLAYFMKPTEEQ